MSDKPSLTPGDLLAEIDRLREHLHARCLVMFNLPLDPENKVGAIDRRFTRAAAGLNVLQFAADSLAEVKNTLGWIEEEIAGRPHGGQR
jgi:hypothetical protein